MKLQGKTAIITGAASGMGLEEARTFAREGANVVIIDVQDEALHKAVEEISAVGEVFGIKADLTKQGDIDNAVAKTLEKYGKIDILINNAGIFDKYASLLDTKDELWDLVMGVDVKGLFRMCRAVLPYMLEQKRGTIINIASIAGMVAGKGGAAYTAAKHAVIGLTKHICSVYAQHGIRVNAICPGTIVTPLIADVVDNIPKDNVPARRFGEPIEVAQLAVFLAGDEAGFINGAYIPIDGGFTVQ